jgi:hypothetical protein
MNYLIDTRVFGERGALLIQYHGIHHIFRLK